MTSVIAQAAINVAQQAFRLDGGEAGKQLIWDRVCRPYLNWRPITQVCRTRFNARMVCHMQDFIQRKIIFFGVWEPQLTAFVERRLQPGDGFIDIGANVGYFSLLASRSVGQHGCVLAIEASPRIHTLLLKNLQLNPSAANVRAVNIAVAEREGRIPIYSPGDDRLGETTMRAERGFVPEGEVRCAPLGRIAMAEEMARARLIKIDVEGAELPVLSDILANINAFRNDVEIVAELSLGEDNAQRMRIGELLEAFGAAGFRAFALENDYSDAAYLNRLKPALPVRLDRLPATQVDVVFSRQTTDTL